MTKTTTGKERSQVVIKGYKVTVKVTDKALSLTDILDDLRGRKLEKI